MYICDYCGRYLKKKYDKCPGCGSESFQKVAGFHVKVIDTPPKGGYKINLDNYQIEKNFYSFPLAFIVFIFGLEFLFCLSFLVTGISLIKEKDLFIGIGFIVVSIILLISSIRSFLKLKKPFQKNNSKIGKDIEKIKTLKTKGILIKNLDYELELVKNKNVGKDVYSIHVLYEIEKGHTLSLKSEPRYLGALGREDGTVDVLIDPNDYENYYIDFEIY